MTLPTGKARNDLSLRARAFTLVELMLVMAMLIIVVGVALPSLKGFFRGRTLDSEARRFLSLTRYGQNRAVSEGVPMMLWIDAKQGAYGLEAAPGFADEDTKAVEFTLHEELRVEVSTPIVATGLSQMRQSLRASTTGNRPMIRFSPDGFIGETSPDRIVIREGDQYAIWIVQSPNRMNYEIQSNPSSSLGR
jgi:Tfp pilus assembly protein FimT